MRTNVNFVALLVTVVAARTPSQKNINTAAAQTNAAGVALNLLGQVVLTVQQNSTKNNNLCRSHVVNLSNQLKTKQVRKITMLFKIYRLSTSSK